MPPAQGELLRRGHEESECACENGDSWAMFIETVIEWSSMALADWVAQSAFQPPASESPVIEKCCFVDDSDKH